jgi:hypothetical protein
MNLLVPILVSINFQIKLQMCHVKDYWIALDSLQTFKLHENSLEK